VATDSIHTPAAGTLLPNLRRRCTLIGLLVAIAGFSAAAIHAVMIEEGHRRFMLAYLVAFSFVLSLSLGAMFFVLIQHLTRAGWSVLVRRPAEILSANMLVVAMLFIPIALSVIGGRGAIYPWAQPDSAAVVHEHVPVPLLIDDEAAPPAAAETATAATTAAEHMRHPHQQLDAFTLKKRPYLNTPFFLVRWILMLAILSGIGWFFWRNSLRQDRTGDPRHTLRMEAAAGPLALVYGLCIMFAAFDLLMSLNPHWYSTIFGIYYFSGAVVGGLAVLVIAVAALRSSQLLPKAVGEEHFLDLGRLLFAFVFFWGYIAFSQYMLLWYANMPEMTAWLRMRGASTVAGDFNAWSYVILVLLFGHFLIPFVGLMSRHAKRRPILLAAWAGWLLLMHYVDLLWLVMPEFTSALTFGAIELGLLTGLCSIYIIGALRLAGGHSLSPVRDPRLPESVAHEPAY
jgi:hypothetical protein